MENGSYTIKFSLTGYTIEPSSLQVTISGSSLELAAVTATPILSTYSISGFIVGIDDNGVAGESDDLKVRRWIVVCDL